MKMKVDNGIFLLFVLKYFSIINVGNFVLVFFFEKKMYWGIKFI